MGKVLDSASEPNPRQLPLRPSPRRGSARMRPEPIRYGLVLGRPKTTHVIQSDQGSAHGGCLHFEHLICYRALLPLPLSVRCHQGIAGKLPVDPAVNKIRRASQSEASGNRSCRRFLAEPKLAICHDVHRDRNERSVLLLFLRAADQQKDLVDPGAPQRDRRERLKLL
jgi:hypothetical protein